MKKLLLTLLTLAVLTPAIAQEFTPYGDRMILQRSDATKICGKAKPNTAITVQLTKGSKTIDAKKIKTDNQGKFTTKLRLKNYGTGYTLTIGEKIYRDVAIGEVWLLSGQSNMSWPLSGSKNAATLAPDSMVRLMLMNPTAVEIRDSMTAEQLDDLNQLRYAQNDGWQYAQGQAMQKFSGIGMFFATKLRQTMPNIPIGMIQTSFGGTTAESFLARNAAQSNPMLSNAYVDWTRNPAINEWCREIATTNTKGATDVNQRHYFQPGFLYDARIAPLTGYTIKGVLWYQGESNAENIPFHDVVFPQLVNSWRKAFNNSYLPFYFVQLSSHNRDSWPAFRDSQRLLAQKIDNCEMVVSHDHGNPTDVHPTAKQPIGERLAAIALARDYGFRMPCYSPIPAKFERQVLSFHNAYQGLSTSDALPPRGIEVSFDGVKFETVPFIIKSNTIIFLVPRHIKSVRYAWKPSTDANIVNSEGLPMSTFTINNKTPYVYEP